MFHGCTRGYGWGEWRITFVEYSSYASGRTLNLYLSRYSCMSSHPRLYCQQINFSTPYPTYQSKSVKIKDLCIDTYRYGSICALKYWLLPSAMHCCVERSSHVMQGRHVCRLPLNKQLITYNLCKLLSTAWVVQKDDQHLQCSKMLFAQEFQTQSARVYLTYSDIICHEHFPILFHSNCRNPKKMVKKLFLLADFGGEAFAMDPRWSKDVSSRGLRNGPVSSAPRIN